MIAANAINLDEVIDAFQDIIDGKVCRDGLLLKSHDRGKYH